MKKTFIEFLTSKGISQVDFDKIEDVEKKSGLYNEYNAELKSYIDELEKNVDGKATKEDLQKAMSELRTAQLDQMKTLNQSIESMGLKIVAMNEGTKAEKTETLKSSLIANVDKIKGLKSGKEGFEMTVKAVGTMLESTNVSGGNVPVEQRIAGLNTIPSRRVRFLDALSRRPANSNLISWVYQSGKEGAAGGTDEGATKNQIDFDLVVASQAVVKRTAFIKVSTEMLDDIDFIESEIRAELMRELLKDVESSAFSGNGTAPNLNGVYTVATAFAAGSFANAVDNANEVDVLVVAKNQIAIAEQDAPNLIFMHPTDVTKLKLVKVSSTDKRYVERLAMIGGNLSLDGIPIVETTLVSVGTYLMGDFNKALLYELGTLRIEMGLDGNDYTKNLRTILAEWRGAVVVRNNDRTAFVKGTFATDIAALETP
jgi:HK97 family phage major capsid protein